MIREPIDLDIGDLPARDLVADAQPRDGAGGVFDVGVEGVVFKDDAGEGDGVLRIARRALCG